MDDPPDLAQALLNPDFYPGTPDGIELVQNPTSYVFLTGEYAYKIKKPVAPGYLDYTSLEKRRFYCNREITLNRRLCPDVYIDTVSISENKDRLWVEGKGKTIEYAVKMTQLPQENMLAALIADNAVPEGSMERIARKLADFHKNARTNDIISDYGDLEFILTNTEYNFLNIIRYISTTLSQKSYRAIKDYTNNFMENNPTLFYERIADGRIRDCHGDIRVEHICLNDDVYIYDCVEFNDSLRYGDVASELALLAVSLEYHGRNDLSKKLVDTYVEITGDDDLPYILNFYKCYRACENGRIESNRISLYGKQDDVTEEIIASAARYFDLAESYIS